MILGLMLPPVHQGPAPHPNPPVARKGQGRPLFNQLEEASK
jgi:hypothetical protein